MVKQESDADAARPEPLLSVPEAARRLNISKSYLYALIKRGILPVVRIGVVLRFRPEDVKALSLPLAAAKRRRRRKKDTR